MINSTFPALVVLVQFDAMTNVIGITTNSEIDSSIVERIPIDMIHDFSFGTSNYCTVQVNCLAL